MYFRMVIYHGLILFYTKYRGNSMLLKIIKRLKLRTTNIIDTILDNIIKIVLAPLVMCFVFGAIGKITKLSFITSVGGFCFFIFFIILVVIIIVYSIILIFLIIYIIESYVLKKSLKGKWSKKIHWIIPQMIAITKTNL